MKRPKVKVQSMAEQANDHEHIKKVFSIRAFNAEAWLKSLDKVALAHYTEFLEHNKNRDTVILKTVETIKEFVVVKVR